MRCDDENVRNNMINDPAFYFQSNTSYHVIPCDWFLPVFAFYFLSPSPLDRPAIDSCPSSLFSFRSRAQLERPPVVRAVRFRYPPVASRPKRQQRYIYSLFCFLTPSWFVCASQRKVRTFQSSLPNSSTRATDSKTKILEASGAPIKCIDSAAIDSSFCAQLSFSASVALGASRKESPTPIVCASRKVFAQKSDRAWIFLSLCFSG